MTQDEPSADARDQETPGYQQSAPDPYAPPYQGEPYGQPNSYQQQPFPSASGIQPPYPVPVQQPLSDSDARLWSTLAHVGVIVTGFIGPLIIWAVLKDRSPLVRQNAAAATNFGLLMTIGYIVGSILLIVLIGGLVIAAAEVLAIVFGIIGAVRANRGEVYPYPFNVKWIR